MQTKFVIIAAPRTGSNFLCTLLGSHPQILCHHEIFNPRGIQYALEFRDGRFAPGGLLERDADPIGFLARLWKIPTQCTCVGFKMTRGQAESVLDHVLHDPSIKKIVLRRRNRVKTLVSELIAQATDQWELYDAETKIEPPRIVVTAAQVHAHAAENDSFYDAIVRLLISTNQRFIELEYETLDRPAEHMRMLRFLGVSSLESPLASVSIKQTPQNLRLVIENFEELDLSLAGTEYQRELRDARR
jgi:hypothetical protein